MIANILVLTLFIGCYSLQTSDCKPLECGNSSDTEKCVVISENSISFIPCTSGSTCGTDFSELNVEEKFVDVECTSNVPIDSSEECPGIEDAGNVRSGFFCCKDSDCFSNSCEDKRCAGVEKDKKCSDVDENCLPGHYCQKNANPEDSECKEGKDDGEKCTRNEECLVGMMCNIEFNQEEGECTWIYSLDAGDKSNEKILCKTNYLTKEEDKCDELDVYIDNTKISEPYECNIGQTCEFRSKVTNEVRGNSACFCDGKHTDTGYCGEFIEYTGVLNSMFKKFRFSSSRCSGKYAHSTDFDVLLYCDSISEELYTYYLNLFRQAIYWPVFQSGALDGCIEDLELFDPSYDVDSFDSASILALTVGYFAFL